MLDPGSDSTKREKMSPISEPNILALDAAGNACSAALWADGRVASERWEAMARGHAEALMPMAEAVVGETGFGALDLVAVTTGPGAYTGLRIAIAAARGLALALDVPVIGIGSFDVHLRRAREGGADGPLMILLETKRAEFYGQAFAADDASHGGPAVMDGERAVAEIAKHGLATAAGDAVGRFAEQQSTVRAVAFREQDASAATLAALAAERWTGKMDVAPPRPLYLRPPDTSPPAADRQILRG